MAGEFDFVWDDVAVEDVPPPPVEGSGEFEFEFEGEDSGARSPEPTPDAQVGEDEFVGPPTQQEIYGGKSVIQDFPPGPTGYIPKDRAQQISRIGKLYSDVEAFRQIDRKEATLQALNEVDPRKQFQKAYDQVANNYTPGSLEFAERLKEVLQIVKRKDEQQAIVLKENIQRLIGSQMLNTEQYAYNDEQKEMWKKDIPVFLTKSQILLRMAMSEKDPDRARRILRGKLSKVRPGAGVPEWTQKYHKPGDIPPGSLKDAETRLAALETGSTEFGDRSEQETFDMLVETPFRGPPPWLPSQGLAGQSVDMAVKGLTYVPRMMAKGIGRAINLPGRATVGFKHYASEATYRYHKNRGQLAVDDDDTYNYAGVPMGEIWTDPVGVVTAGVAGVIGAVKAGVWDGDTADINTHNLFYDIAQGKGGDDFSSNYHIFLERMNSRFEELAVTRLKKKMAAGLDIPKGGWQDAFDKEIQELRDNDILGVALENPQVSHLAWQIVGDTLLGGNIYRAFAAPAKATARAIAQTNQFQALKRLKIKGFGYETIRGGFAYGGKEVYALDLAGENLKLSDNANFVAEGEQLQAVASQYRMWLDTATVSGNQSRDLFAGINAALPGPKSAPERIAAGAELLSGGAANYREYTAFGGDLIDLPKINKARKDIYKLSVETGAMNRAVDGVIAVAPEVENWIPRAVLEGGQSKLEYLNELSHKYGFNDLSEASYFLRYKRQNQKTKNAVEDMSLTDRILLETKGRGPESKRGVVQTTGRTRSSIERTDLGEHLPWEKDPNIQFAAKGPELTHSIRTTVAVRGLHGALENNNMLWLAPRANVKAARRAVNATTKIVRPLLKRQAATEKAYQEALLDLTKAEENLAALNPRNLPGKYEKRAEVLNNRMSNEMRRFGYQEGALREIKVETNNVLQEAAAVEEKIARAEKMQGSPALKARLQKKQEVALNKLERLEKKERAARKKRDEAQEALEQVKKDFEGNRTDTAHRMGAMSTTDAVKLKTLTDKVQGLEIQIGRYRRRLNAVGERMPSAQKALDSAKKGLAGEELKAEDMAKIRGMMQGETGVTWKELPADQARAFAEKVLPEGASVKGGFYAVMPKEAADILDTWLPRIGITQDADIGKAKGALQKLLMHETGFLAKTLMDFYRITHAPMNGTSYVLENILSDPQLVFLNARWDGLGKYGVPSLGGALVRYTSTEGTVMGRKIGAMLMPAFEDGTRITIEEFMGIIKKHGVAAMTPEEYALPAGSQGKTLGTKIVGLPLEALRKAFKVTGYQAALSFTEDWRKISTFANVLKGPRPDQIAKALDETADLAGSIHRMGTYDNHMRHVFTYWSWDRYFYKRMMKASVTNPEMLALSERWTEYMNMEHGKQFPTDGREIPSWMKESGAYIAPPDQQIRGLQGKYIMNVPYTLRASIGATGADQSALTGRFAPAFKMTLMALTGRNIDTGKPLPEGLHLTHELLAHAIYSEKDSTDIIMSLKRLRDMGSKTKVGAMFMELEGAWVNKVFDIYAAFKAQGDGIAVPEATKVAIRRFLGVSEFALWYAHGQQGEPPGEGSFAARSYIVDENVSPSITTRQQLKALQQRIGEIDSGSEE